MLREIITLGGIGFPKPITVEEYEETYQWIGVTLITELSEKGIINVGFYELDHYDIYDYLERNLVQSSDEAALMQVQALQSALSKAIQGK